MYIFTYAYDDKDANELYSGLLFPGVQCHMFNNLLKNTTWAEKLSVSARRTPGTVPGTWTCLISIRKGTLHVLS